MSTHATLAVRRLKSGTYDEWREAWTPDEWLAGAKKAYILRNVEDPDLVVALVVVDIELDGVEEDRESDQHSRRYERMGPYVESIETDGVFEVEEITPTWD